MSDTKIILDTITYSIVIFFLAAIALLWSGNEYLLEGLISDVGFLSIVLVVLLELSVFKFVTPKNYPFEKAVAVVAPAVHKAKAHKAEAKHDTPKEEHGHAHGDHEEHSEEHDGHGHDEHDEHGHDGEHESHDEHGRHEDHGDSHDEAHDGHGGSHGEHESGHGGGHAEGHEKEHGHH